MEFVTYEDFGAVGDGCADDFEAIKKAHEYANLHNLPVKTNAETIYFIGSKLDPAVIMTDTDWGDSKFVIDDCGAVHDISADIFEIVSRKSEIHLLANAYKLGQEKLDFKSDELLRGDVFVVAENEKVKNFKRVGLNESDGATQTDCFIMDQEGKLLTPLIWDFESFSKLIAYPIDEEKLTVQGGYFTTIANQGPAVYNYYGRGIGVRRSNVHVKGISHFVIAELGQGSPYRGFLNTNDCAHVTFEDCHLTGHKIYETIGSAGLPVRMGSYDINCHRSIDVMFLNCRQDDFQDETKWGIFGSNYCKDIIVDGCTFSRVDAHMGVVNLTVKNSTIGWMGIKAIGWGQLTIENTIVYCSELLEFRPDYGSHWAGDVLIKDVTWHPIWNQSKIILDEEGDNLPPFSAILSENTGEYDFGYICTQPKSLTISNLTVIDEHLTHHHEYQGIFLFQVVDHTNQGITDFTGEATHQHPYLFTAKMRLEGLRTHSGKGFILWSRYPEAGYYKDKVIEVGGAVKANCIIQIQDVENFRKTDSTCKEIDERKNIGTHKLFANILHSG